MSPRKRKTQSAPQLTATFDAIDDIITRLKPKLTDLGSKASRPSLLDDLQHLAILGETFSGQRSKADADVDLTDSLDREGVHLWNTSGLLCQGLEGDEDHTLFAALRFAAFRLIEAGIERDPNDEVMINMLQLASKTGTALSDCGRGDAAMSVLGCAAKYEENLRNSDDGSNETNERNKARAVVHYLSSRMLAAWKDGNDAIAEFMLEKITESESHRLRLVSAADRELLASRILGVGKGILKTSSQVSADGSVTPADAKRAQDAVKWIQRSFALVEKMEDTETAGLVDLKRSILRSLARGYYMASSIDLENLSRAEATLQELIASIEDPVHNTEANPEHQQLRWMRVAVLKKRNAPEGSMLAALRSIVVHANFTDSEITDILQELRTFQHHALISEVLNLCFKLVLGRHSDFGTGIVDRLLLALVSHCSRDSDHARALQEIEAACSYLTDSEYELSKAPASACLTVLWKSGDRLYHSKTWSQAADWFLLGTHQAFASIAEITSPKCLRKAALCYLEQREYSRATHTIQRCPKGKASTFYLTFLAALYQGQEDEATAAIVGMANAADFDRKMLLLATQLAHESDSKAVLLTALEALLKTVYSHGPMDSDSEAILLVRCILRLVIRLRKECSLQVERLSLSVTLINHFRTAVGLAKTAIAGKKGPIFAKDISWFWRTAYNVAVESCSEGQLSETQIADLFECACELAETYASIEIANPDATVNLCVVRAAFASVSARVFAFRNSSIADGEKDVLANIHRVKKVIKGKNAPESSMQEVSDMLCTCQIFEIEIYCIQRAWDRVLEAVIATDASASSLPMFEAITDLVWSEKDCPVTVIYTILEAILHCCLDRGITSVEKFSRWLRAICTILLSRNSQQDRKKAITYAEQALTVMDDPDTTGESYPMDERYWLLSISYNTGVDCLASSELNEAKRWFEVSTVICRFVPDGARHSERISETYQKLLAQYSPDDRQERT